MYVKNTQITRLGTKSINFEKKNKPLYIYLNYEEKRFLSALLSKPIIMV